MIEENNNCEKTIILSVGTQNLWLISCLILEASVIL